MHFDVNTVKSKANRLFKKDLKQRYAFVEAELEKVLNWIENHPEATPAEKEEYALNERKTAAPLLKEIEIEISFKGVKTLSTEEIAVEKKQRQNKARSETMKAYHQQRKLGNPPAKYRWLTIWELMEKFDNA